MPVSLKGTFVCISCRIKVDDPQVQGRFPRCAAGHRVERLRTRSLFHTGFFALVISLIVVGSPVNALEGSWISMLPLAAVVLWSSYSIVRGAYLLRLGPPVDRIGRQRIVVGVACVCAAMFIVWYAWSMRQTGYWPSSH